MLSIFSFIGALVCGLLLLPAHTKSGQLRHFNFDQAKSRELEHRGPMA